MNGEQARAMQREFNERTLVWDGVLYVEVLTMEEWRLFVQLYQEFWPDAGNLYRIPLIVRETD